MTLSNGGVPIFTTPATDVSYGSTVFTETTVNFTAPSNLTGSSVLTLTNSTDNNVSDFTEDFANLSLIDNSATPEPSTWALLGAGALAFCLAGRRLRAKTA